MQCFALLRVYKSRRYQKKHGKRNQRIHQRLATEEASSTAAFARRLRTDGVSDCGADDGTDGRCGGSVSGCVRESSDQHFYLRRKESLTGHMAESHCLQRVGELLDDNEMETAVEDLPSDHHDDEQAVLLLEQAMALLPTTEQMLLSLFYYESRSLQEIAYITDSKPTTIGSRLSRIRKKLYHLIQQISEQ